MRIGLRTKIFKKNINLNVGIGLLRVGYFWLALSIRPYLTCGDINF